MSERKSDQDEGCWPRHASNVHVVVVAVALQRVDRVVEQRVGVADGVADLDVALGVGDASLHLAKLVEPLVDDLARWLLERRQLVVLVEMRLQLCTRVGVAVS